MNSGLFMIIWEVYSFQILPLQSQKSQSNMVELSQIIILFFFVIISKWNPLLCSKIWWWRVDCESKCMSVIAEFSMQQLNFYLWKWAPQMIFAGSLLMVAHILSLYLKVIQIRYLFVSTMNERQFNTNYNDDPRSATFDLAAADLPHNL